MKRPGVSRPNPAVLCGQRAVPRVGPTTCASQQGLQELSPRAPRDGSDVGCARQVPPPSRGDIPRASFHKPAHLNAGDSAHRKRGPPRKRPRVEAQHRHLTTPRAGGSGLESSVGVVVGRLPGWWEGGHPSRSRHRCY